MWRDLEGANPNPRFWAAQVGSWNSDLGCGKTCASYVDFMQVYSRKIPTIKQGPESETLGNAKIRDSEPMDGSLALDLTRGKNVLILMDSTLEGQYDNDDATKLVDLAITCLHYVARARPNLKFIISAIASLQTQKEEASHVLMGQSKTTVVLPTMLSPLGKACARMDLTTVHDILLKTGYRDEEGAEDKFSFEAWWVQPVKETLNAKKFGDTAFRAKDFKSAIDYYSELVDLAVVSSATVFVRRGLSYLMLEEPDLALRDAMQAQVCMPEWPVAFYLQALALSKLGMEEGAQEIFNKGVTFEEQNNWCGQVDQNAAASDSNHSCRTQT